MAIQDNEFIEMIKQVDINDEVRDEHRQDLKRRVLEAYDHAASNKTAARPAASPLRGFFTGRAMRMAASIALLLAVGAVGYLAFSPARALAFEVIARAILKIHSATYNMTLRAPDGPEQKFKMYVDVPGRMRQENANGTIQIADYAKGRLVYLNPEDKTAIVAEITAIPREKMPINIIDGLREYLRNAADNKDEGGRVKYKAVGNKQIDGRKAIGFLLDDPEFAVTIWGDVETGLPIRIEQKMDFGDVKYEVTLNNVDFNQELDKALFSVAPPEGYTTQSQKVDIDLSTPDESDLFASLKLYAANSDGEFPNNLNPADISRVIATRFIEKQADDAGLDRSLEDSRKAARELANKMTRLSMKIARGLFFASALDVKSDKHYAGKGVKLGEADKPIFWYKPKGKDTYRVIYGDLSVKNAKTAPKVPVERKPK